MTSLDPVDLPSRLAQDIRELINDGILAPGAQLAQHALAARFGVSRAPIREVLKLLLAENVVEHDPNKGFQVARLSSTEARQLYRVRHLIESAVLATVRWPSDDELSVLRARLAELDNLLAMSERAAWLKAHRHFHSLIFGLSPERIMAREALRLMRQTDRYRALAPRMPLGATQHPAKPEHNLVDALAMHDRDALLRVYHDDRSEVECSLVASLEARGL
ncbi:GntR family transcriptional regulator [Pandoraea oxalativorans]|uniref:GntR family transcriptional regulator n=1 Tax=Pandoraea oxalativorans TaxID=573737 RepID=A0A0E3YH90_9BURK|nr:GntR family transcriptional regulator [Pandoraea oxalativorans]